MARTEWLRQADFFMQQLLARAEPGGRQPEMVYVTAHKRWPFSVGTTREVVPDTAVVIAQTDCHALAVWLARAINATLDNSEYTQVKPAGCIERSGHFAVAAGNLFAWSWSWSWSHSGMQVARDIEDSLAERLNALCACSC